jgi:virulence factor
MKILVQQIIDRYKAINKQHYLNNPSRYRHSYAFVGAGNHSIANLYPCIQYLGVPVKFINTRTADSGLKMARRFQDCQATTDLNTIIEDKSITGVFVCVHPSQHFPIVKRLLEHGKSVFVEKPPCLRLEQLKELIEIKNKGICVVGLQKRFSVVNHHLRKRVKHTLSYHYRYLTGQYPEGDPVTDLFIHPIDNAIDLFGPVSSMQVSKNSAVTDFHLMLNHEKGVRGLVEVSTLYSWASPVDQLEVNTEKEILKASYPNSLTGYLKPAVIMGVPLEKAFKQAGREKNYVSNDGFVPVAENNSLYMQGFLGEIEHFVNLVEKKETINRCSLESLVGTFTLLEKMKQG